MDRQVELLGNDDVISGDSTWVLEDNTYIASDLLETTREVLDINSDRCDKDWLIHESECKVLRVGESQGWRKGKLKVRVKILLEFEPEVLQEADLDENISLSESPLDRLRS
jgi:KGK domain